MDASIGVGLLFDGPNDMPSSPVSDKTKQRKSSDIARPAGSSKQRIPNPYEPSSSESEDDLEADLEEVQQIRRSLRRPQQHPHRQPTTSDRSKKGWLAHQSVFPPSSSSSSSETDESDKQTEADSDAGMEERSRMMGLSRAPGTRGKNGRTSRSRRSDDASDSLHGYALSPSELHKANLGARHAQADDLEEPLLGPDEMGGDGRSTRPPVRLQVYHGRFAHWEREGLRKYKGRPQCGFMICSSCLLTIGGRFRLLSLVADERPGRFDRAAFRLGVHRGMSVKIERLWFSCLSLVSRQRTRHRARRLLSFLYYHSCSSCLSRPWSSRQHSSCSFAILSDRF